MKKIIFVILFSPACMCFTACKKEIPGNDQQPTIITPAIKPTSKIFFWTKDPYDGNYGYGIVPIDVSINNETKTLSSYYEFPGPNAPLPCTAIATLRFDLTIGIYSWTARRGFNERASGSFAVIGNECLTIEIVF